MNIEVLEIKKVSNAGKLRAFAKLKLGEIICCDFRVIQQEGQKAWVSVPQLGWTGTDGKVRYKNMVELPEKLKSEVFKAILAAWNN